MGSKLDRMGDATPGPGTYSPDHHAKLNKAPQFTVGTQQRVMLKELNSNPGPGIYQNNIGKGGSSFGTSTRVKLKYDNSPGPGSYKIPV